MTDKKKMRGTHLKRWLVAGLLVWVPLSVTYFVVRFGVELTDRVVLLLPPAYRPEVLLGFRLPGLGVVLVFAVLLVTGFLAANFVGRRLVHVWEAVLSRVPLVSPIYAGAKKVSETVLSGSGQAFRKVLLVEYPRRGLYSLAFQTSDQPGEIQALTGKDLLCVFVPTTPNPTSGFLIMAPRDEVFELEMSVDEAVRTIISLGVIVPGRPLPRHASPDEPASAPAP